MLEIEHRAPSLFCRSAGRCTTDFAGATGTRLRAFSSFCSVFQRMHGDDRSTCLPMRLGNQVGTSLPIRFLAGSGVWPRVTSSP